MTALCIGLYFAVRFIVTPPRTHPGLLAPTIFLGAVLGVVVANWTQLHRDRLRRLGDRRVTSEARWYVFGLAGAALLLARVFPAAGLEWLALGLTALTAGGAGHAWITARSQEREAEAG